MAFVAGGLVGASGGRPPRHQRVSGGDPSPGETATLHHDLVSDPHHGAPPVISGGAFSWPPLAHQKRKPGPSPAPSLQMWCVQGGGGGIRTHGALRTRDFQSRPLGLYGTPPGAGTRIKMASGTAPTRRIGRSAGGKGGIRTHGALFKHTAFRERHHQPLGHLSATQYST